METPVTEQTAINWLNGVLDSILDLTPSEYEKVQRAIATANEMFRDQIETAYSEGIDNLPSMRPQQYYTNTFGK
jgi:hypothetical protein